MSNKHLQEGFSLVELSIVILIMGLLLAGLMMPLSAQRENARIRDGKEQLETVMSAQAERVKTAKEEAAVTADPIRRAELVAEIEAARPLFVAAGLEYAADFHPIRVIDIRIGKN